MRFNGRFSYLLVFLYTLQAIPTSFAEKGEVLKKRGSEYLQSTSSGFVENKGQIINDNGAVMNDVFFKSSIPEGDLYITNKGLTYAFYKIEDEDRKEKEHKNDENISIRQYRMDVDLKGASIKKENIITESTGSCVYNFFYEHCPNGIMRVNQYKKITIKNVYPNIDWVWKIESDNQLKYDFILHPGADITSIKLLYKGGDLTLKENGRILQISTPIYEFKEGNLLCYDEKRTLSSSFKITKNEVSFSIPNIDLNATTIIDPPLIWCTTYCGSGYTGIKATECDKNGNLFVTGYTNSPNFPTQNAGVFFQGNLVMFYDVFIIKFDPQGNRIWATYYGANDDDVGNDIKLDVNGNIFVTGSSKTTNGFPVQNPGGGAYYQPANGGAPAQDAFMLKFDNNGNRIWATYFGGSNMEVGDYLYIDNNGDVFMTGITVSTNLPTKNANGFFQGSSGGFADVMLTKFSNSGVLLWSSYYGGTGFDEGYSITGDANGNVFFAGVTKSPNFPTQNNGNYFDGTFSGISDLFVLKFDNTFTRQWASYIGGSSEEELAHIIITANNELFFVGNTASNDFVTANNPLPGSYNDASFNGITDVVIMKFDNNGALLWSTFYGSPGGDLNTPYDYDRIAKDGCGNVYFTNSTRSSGMPIKVSANNDYLLGTYKGGNDLFISKFSENGIHKWGTYFGHIYEDLRGSLAIDDSGAVYVGAEFANYPNAASLPLLDQGNGAYFQNVVSGTDNGFIAKFEYGPLMFSGNVTPACTCDGTATVIPSGGLPPYTYLWNTNPPQTTATAVNLCAGNHTVTVTDANCHSKTFTITVTSNGPDATIGTIVPVNCKGESNGAATININGGVAPLTYTWYPNIGNTLTVNGLPAGTYYFVVRDANGCFDSIPVYILEPNDSLSAISSVSNISCGSGEATVLGTGGTPPYSYLWLPSGGNGPIATGLNIGTYNCTITDAHNCTFTETVTITVPPAPIAAFTASPLTGPKPLLVTFVNSSTNGNSYQWDFGDGNTSTLENPTNTFLTNGTYEVRLIVTNTGGCSDTITVKIIVEGDITLIIPNIFTPNGDGVNDLFLIKSSLIKEFNLQIFNRWGNIVTEINDVSQSWDGKSKSGNYVADGTYYYVIKAIGLDDIDYSTKGFVTVEK